MGTKQNFKTALNELMAGKIATDEEGGESAAAVDCGEDAVPQPAEPVFNKPSYTAAYTPPAAHMSVIAADLLIEGNVKSKSDIRVDGHIRGNVICDGSIACGGVVEGDIRCHSLVMSGCSINGNISAKADVTVDPESTIIGDISAHNLVANGRIKGNISTTGATALRENAMLMGNIHAKSISLDAGAALKGTLEVQTADLSDEDFRIRPTESSPTGSAPVQTPGQPASEPQRTVPENTGDVFGVDQ